MHPAIQVSQVLGKKDLMRGEVVKAHIVLKKGHSAEEKEITALLQNISFPL